MKVYITQDDDGIYLAWRWRPSWNKKERFWFADSGAWDVLGQSTLALWLLKVAGVEAPPKVGKYIELEVTAKEVKR